MDILLVNIQSLYTQQVWKKDWIEWNELIYFYFLVQCPGTPVCSSHGTCSSNGQCICANGYAGNDCSVGNKYNLFTKSNRQLFSFT